jgi:hypothetical protein
LFTPKNVAEQDRVVEEGLADEQPEAENRPLGVGPDDRAGYRQ